MRLIICFLSFTFLSAFTPFISISNLALESKKEVFIIQNMPNDEKIPRNFRAADNHYYFERLQTLDWVPSRHGLDRLPISGSSQFSQNGLKAILTQLPLDKKLVVVDLRQESHGFLNGMATSWYSNRDWANLGKSSDQVDSEERELLKKAKDRGEVIVYTDKYAKKALKLKVDSVNNEERLMTSNGLDYKRFYVTDHRRPSDEDVEAFIEFINQLPRDSWIHFHCAAGKGRTTTFMAMYDIYQNAKEVSLEDIIKRQWLIGGLDLSEIPEKSNWKYPYVLERYQFLQEFYEYSRNEPIQASQSWTEWVNSESRSNSAMSIAQPQALVNQ